MYFAMDMGTTNTRVWLCDGNLVKDFRKGHFGAKLGMTQGKSELYRALRELLDQLLAANSLDAKDVEGMIVSGMAGSEMGLCEIPHIGLPVDMAVLADHLVLKHIGEIGEFPMLFVPGIKITQGEKMLDIIRGEETETLGIISHLPRGESAVILLPGTHNKLMRVNGRGEMINFCSTMSGEILDLLISKSILTSGVSHEVEISPLEVMRGREYAKKNGLNAAAFHVRVMEKNGACKNALSSFLYGAVLGEDVELIRAYARGDRIYVGGNKSLQSVYCQLLECDMAQPLDREIAEGATCKALMQLYRVHYAKAQREKIIQAIKEEKLIAILRKPDADTLPEAVEAMYRGGVRLLEITFDRSGAYPHALTAQAISSVTSHFEGRVLVGAGTVTSCEDVIEAFEAGASFIISPNCDPDVIALTKQLGLVSIPAAFTPTEIAAALQAGADFVKVFPADQLGKGYVKAVKAPLSDAKLLAVGGVNAENAGEFLKMGFCGVGVGSNLYNQALIRAGDFQSLKTLAKRFTDAVKE